MRLLKSVIYIILFGCYFFKRKKKYIKTCGWNWFYGQFWNSHWNYGVNYWLSFILFKVILPQQFIYIYILPMMLTKQCLVISTLKIIWQTDLIICHLSTVCTHTARRLAWKPAVLTTTPHPSLKRRIFSGVVLLVSVT